MTDPKPQSESAKETQEPKPAPGEVVEVPNLTLEVALKIVRELIDQEESRKHK